MTSFVFTSLFGSLELLLLLLNPQSEEVVRVCVELERNFVIVTILIHFIQGRGWKATLVAV